MSDDGRDVSQKSLKSRCGERLNALSPLELLVALYDVSIEFCEREDRAGLASALAELTSALNFAHRDVSVPLFRLYDYCIRQGQAGNFQAVAPILRQLRETWRRAAMSPDRPPRLH